jgi:hypothetical protein
MRYVPPISRFLQDSHGVTSQKTAFFTNCPIPRFRTQFLSSRVVDIRDEDFFGHVRALEERGEVSDEGGSVGQCYIHHTSYGTMLIQEAQEQLRFAERTVGR